MARDKSLGLVLRRRREDLNLTQATLAEKIDYSRFQVAKWEQGQSNWPKRRERQIEDAVNVPPGFFEAIRDGTDYETALTGGGVELPPRVIRRTAEQASLDDKLRTILAIKAGDYTQPQEALRIQSELCGRISQLLDRAYIDLGITERDVLLDKSA